MVDTAISKAVLEKARIEAKIAESEARTRRFKLQLTEINNFISQWEKFSGVSAPKSNDVVASTQTENLFQFGTDSVSASPKNSNSKKEEVALAAKRIIEDCESPIPRSELYARLSAQGLRMNGANPEMVLSTMLWRAGKDQRIVRLKSGGYWLADRPVANGDGIDPETHDGSDIIVESVNSPDN